MIVSQIRNKFMLKKGDRVLVWSLQSFFDGGFLKGEPAFVKQDQNEGGSSVIVSVIRKIRGEYKIDESYEVYREQVKKVMEDKWDADEHLKQYRENIMTKESTY